MIFPVIQSQTGWDGTLVERVPLSPCFDRVGPIHLVSVMADSSHFQAPASTAHPPLPPPSYSHRSPETRRIFHIPHHSCPTVCLSVWGWDCVCVCVCENRHLERHDEVCEMKLGLEVQLDGHILHACRREERAWLQFSVFLQRLVVVENNH